MKFLEKIRRLIVRAVRVNLDLLALWILLTALQPSITPDNPLARNDLAPWTMACLASVAFLRGKILGQGPHRMLTLQHSGFGRWCHRAAMVLTPIALLFWYDTGRYLDSWEIAEALMTTATTMSVIIGVALVLGRKEGRTAWDPRGVRSGLLWGAGVVSIIVATMAVGYLENLIEALPLDRPIRRGTVFPGDILLLGIAFLGVGLITGRAKHLRQRLTSGLKDGSPFRPKMFPFFFASLGSAVGLWGLYFLQDFFRIGIGLDFDEAFIPAAFVVAWAAVVWPPRTPIGVTCLLHEVLPTGGGDARVEKTARPFEMPPEGALRLNPLKIRRVRSVHPWLVPVKASRIDYLDDPIRPLWNRREPPLPYHILGHANFESDTLTKQAQWDRLTIRLKGQDETSGKLKGSARSKRLVVLRPFLQPGESRKSQIKTYIWDRTVPDATVQIVDANTETLTLTDGCVIVLSTEGVARAFELEIGAPVYELNEAINFRPPQLEDYVKV
ncbi:MAG: hypothetical protein ACI8RZ_003319 [Myxococcota bacterium]|jgi:hypothetical protein